MSDSKNDKCISLEDMYKKMMSTLSSASQDFSMANNYIEISSHIFDSL